jgi:hypothetical protein
LTHFASFNFYAAIFCVIYSNDTKEITFELNENYIQLPPFCAQKQCTTYAKYIGISNNFACLRGFMLLFSLLGLHRRRACTQGTLPRLPRLPGAGITIGHKIVRV